MQLLHNIPLLKSANGAHPSASSGRIADIQGLRGISIVAVFVYHLHSSTLPMGFLGVDVFFGISGFLMATILSKQKPLDWTKCRSFYFRRVKRIVPVYLFVILLVLGTAGGFFLNPTDFHALFHEAAKPLLYVANIPAPEDTAYSAEHTNHYPFFKHCWSLCVEIQWYILAPLFLSILELYSRSARLLILSLISALSFAVQWNSSGNFEHMALVNRLWQFLLGIVAFEVQEARVDEDKEEKAERWKHWAQRFLDFFFPLFLVLLLASPLSPHRQLHRLLLMATTTIILSRSGSHFFLSQPTLTELGNVSYSIYMVHWPLIQAYTYTWPVFGVIDVVGMFVAGVLLGFLLEKSYNRLAVHITSWFSLLSALFVLYVLILDSLLFLRLHTPDQRLLSDEKFVLEDPAQVEADAIAMWRGTFERPLTPLDSALYSRQFHRLNWDSTTCPNTNKTAIPTTFDLRKIGLSTMDDIEGISASCVVEGNGTKNVVMFGNSHALAGFFGIERNFRGVYRHLTMISAGSCMLIEWKGEIPTPSAKVLAACGRFVRFLFDALAEWKHPIDIIVVAHAYLPSATVVNQPFIDADRDEPFRQLQAFYSRLSTFAREVVFIPQMQHLTGVIPHMPVLIRRVLNRQDLSPFRQPLENVLRTNLEFKRRLVAVKCPNCILLDWTDLWCDRRAAVCDSVDLDHKVSFFFDFNHVNALGSLRVGEFTRKHYDRWLELQDRTSA